MMKNLILFTILFYFLTIFQTSFLAHFSIKGIVINFILVALFVINILEEPETNTGIFAAGVSGFFWDIFSDNFIGFHILILIFLALSIKIILARYVRIKIFQRA
jgi:rod shape-determining protein MreD